MSQYKNILPSAAELAEESMRFRIFDAKGHEVMGQNAELTTRNAVFMGLKQLLTSDANSLNSLPKVSGSHYIIKPTAKITDLGLNESVQGRFVMSDTVGEYRIVRVK